MIDDTDLIQLRIMEIYGRNRIRNTPQLDRAMRAFANFRLAILEEGYDEWIEMHDGFDWVTLKCDPELAR